MTAYAGVFFESSLSQPQDGGGLRVRTKDQDFAITRRLWMKTSHSRNYKDAAEEATGTARDLKIVMPGAKYFLVCDWLDMKPINTANTPIDEALLLRKGKRIAASKRKSYDTYAGRRADRAEYVRYLQEHPYSADVLKRFVTHIRRLLADARVDEERVLNQGYF